MLEDDECISSSFIDPEFDDLEGTEGQIVADYRNRNRDED